MVDRQITTLEEMYALIKFRLVSLSTADAIEAEINRMVDCWVKNIDPSIEGAEALRTRLFTLARDGLIEDDEAMKRRKH
jgi:hypothetical protein